MSSKCGADFHYYITENDGGIGRKVFWAGIQAFEPGTMRIFPDLIDSTDTFIDVGANTGLYTLVGASLDPNLETISFEPVPRLYELLSKNINENGWDERCKTVQSAVSSEEGTTELHDPDIPQPTSASLHKEGFRGTDGSLVEVDVTTLDNFISRPDEIGLVKIDVEGFEDKVLEGAAELLSHHVPLIIEANFDGPNVRVDEILRDAGYADFYGLTEDRAQKLNKFESDSDKESSGYQNVLCL